MAKNKNSKTPTSIILFILVTFGGAFGAGWLYLESQRLKVAEDRLLVTTEKLKLDQKVKELSIDEKIQAVEKEKLSEKYKERFRLLEIAEEKVQHKYQQQSRDEELSKLTLKYIDEVAGIDLGKTCGNDPEHNNKVKKGNALLSLIESKALEYGRKDLVDTFVKDQRLGQGIWSAKCNVNVSVW